MYTDGTYPVLRCGRCSLIHPHDYRLCPRCGATESAVAHVSRRQVESAAVEFFVRADAVALPREVAARLATEPVAERQFAPAALLVELGRRVHSLVAAVTTRPA